MFNPIFLARFAEPWGYRHKLSDVDIKDTIRIILDEGSPEDIASLAKAIWGGKWEIVTKEEHFVDYSISDLRECDERTELNAECFFYWNAFPNDGIFNWDLTRK